MQSMAMSPRWINRPAVLDDEITSALTRAIKQILAGLGCKGPFGPAIAPIELSGGYLNVSRTPSGGVMAHWEPHGDLDDDDMIDEDIDDEVHGSMSLH